jgi:hypothetical protein
MDGGGYTTNASAYDSDSLDIHDRWNVDDSGFFEKRQRNEPCLWLKEIQGYVARKQFTCSQRIPLGIESST